MAEVQEYWQRIIDQIADNRVRLKVYRGTNKAIEDLPDEDGALYFAYDSGAIFLGYNTGTRVEKIQMSSTTSGAGGSGIVYANADEEDGTLFEIEDETDENHGKYKVFRTAFEEDLVALPGKDTLIVNSNGWLFRVLKVYGSDGYVLAELVSTGTGGGGGSGGNVRDLDLTYTGINLIGSQYVYNKSYDIIFYPSSTADEVCSLLITAVDNTGKNPTVTRSYTVTNNTPCKFNVNLLPLSSDISLTALVTSVHSEYNKKRGYSNVFPVSTLDMRLERHSESNFIGVQTGDASLAYIPYFRGLGTETEPVKLFYSVDDGTPVLEKRLKSSDAEGRVYATIPHQAHGNHRIKLWLGVTMNGIDFTSEAVIYEVPFVDAGNTSPIIWVKEDLGTIVQYEEAVVQYMIYSPNDNAAGRSVEVQFLKDGVIFNSEEVKYSSQWLRWDITANYDVGRNNFTIACGSVIKNIEFQVTTEGARDLSLKYLNELELNFDAMGRSSKEIKANRSIWKSSVLSKITAEAYNAELTGFNWYNNGWKNDNNGLGSYLSITNGAKVTIPTPVLTLNTADSPWTFEIRFRIRNAKKFATLVTEIPLYKYTIDGVENEAGKELTLEEIEALKNKPENAGKEIAVKVDADGNKEMNEANTTKKAVIKDKYIAFSYLNNNGQGFAVGTQEAYFNTGSKVVNVKYKEDEVINIAFVVDKGHNQLSIYLNGILSGVADLASVGGFTMENVPFIANSDYCDLDIYRFRAYPKPLSMPDIIHNYIADIKSLDTYDENQLTNANDETVLSYDKLLEFNASHVSSPSMPYAVIDMTQTPQGTDLPHYKGANRAVRIEFTNPTADYLLSVGQCTDWQYYTRSPSYAADNVDLNVQGTSSQIYPRRNFKAKFKSAKNTWIYTSGPLAGRPIADVKYYFTKDGAYDPTTEQMPDESAEEYSARSKTFKNTHLILNKKWHMDSEQIGVNKFTWKIDYMESSGSYNTGFANLMGNNIYSKHPLEDLNISGLDTSKYRTSVYGFPMMVFHKTGEGQYTYIGRYNMNLDKSANEAYGYEEEIEQPYVTAVKYNAVVEDATYDENLTYYVNNNGNYETATITSGFEPEVTYYLKETYHPLIKDISECWELRDNQGTWCSFRYPNQEMRQAGFRSPMADSNPSDPKIEVVNHFEARYNAKADQFEYAQNILLGKQNEDDYSADIGGTTNTVASNYCYNRLKNLEILFNWLDSTDTRILDNENYNYTSFGEGNEKILEVSSKLTKQMPNPERGPDYDIFLKPTDPGYKPEFIYIEDEEAMLQQGVTYESREVGDSLKTFGRFTKDSREYRRQKFYAEFDKHLDKEYCAIYFVMTELLLCYDSRGKNMMVSTFGPKEAGGDYIWYPIFYDIDTQLGLNNVGAKLWDYDEDNSENGTFSTAQSVLWTNFYDVFRNTVESTYRTLRNGKLSYETIEGAYNCDPKIFNTSFAMRGRRPTVAIGLDEYYKYVLPVTQPWKNQEGSMITANYLYACQGDRILSRELLINNRLLYMDSKWLGGTFTISTGGMAGIMFRGTANHAGTTSDKYIEGTVGTGQTYAQYPVPYYDATPEYYVTPYLNFYITTFVDENVSQVPEAYNPEKYPNGIPTIVSESVRESYKSGRVDQQLNYFAGSSYISSLGDLSTKYANQIKIPNTPRLLDITLGSDVPDYFNGETLDPFELYTEIDEATGKPVDGAEKSLLNKIILTNLKGLNKGLDVRSPDKLTEFRALGTPLQYALFAEGAPLRAVHLPNTVTKLSFIQNKNLTKILTSTPIVLDMVEGVAVPRALEEYEGLFVDGITNYNPSDETMQGDSNIAELDFEGDALGYGSYVILENTVKRREGTNTRLSIRMADIHWTPYTQVEYGEKKLLGIDYYYLTDHSTYIPYAYTTDEAWAEDTLNGRVYTYDENAGKEIDPVKGEKIISDLSLLDKFYLDYTTTVSGINQFTNNMETMLGVKSYPTISGELYVANQDGAAINELTLTNKYNACWPDLIIRAANVQEAPAVRYLEIDPSTNKEKQLDIKYSEDNKIVLTDKAAPNRVHFDFLGWSPNKPGTTENYTFYVVLNSNNEWTTTTEGAAATIDPETNTMSLYAIFVPHPYPATFDFDNGTAPVTITTIWEQGKIGLNSPNTIPNKPYPYADDEMTPSGELGLYRTYAFKGWAYVGDEEQTIQVLENLPPDHVYSFIAIYEDKSVYDNVIDLKYLDYDLNVDGESYYIGINPAYVLSGKITLPTRINNKPVTQLGSNAANFSGEKGVNITHIFWAQQNRALTTINLSCFAKEVSQTQNPALQYLEPVPSCQTIKASAFSNCSNLKLSNLTELLENATDVGGTAFLRVGRGNDIVVPGHEFVNLANQAFGGWSYATGVTIGSYEEPCQWCNMLGSVLTSNSQLFNSFAQLSAGILKIHIYLPSADNTESKKANLLQALGFGATINNDNYRWTENDTSPYEEDGKTKSYTWIIVD